MAEQPLDALGRQLDRIRRAQEQPQPRRKALAIDHARVAQASALEVEVAPRQRLLAALALVVGDYGVGEIDDARGMGDKRSAGGSYGWRMEVMPAPIPQLSSR